MEILSFRLQVRPFGVLRAPLQQDSPSQATVSDGETSSEAANSLAKPPWELEEDVEKAISCKLGRGAKMKIEIPHAKLLSAASFSGAYCR